jgi:hypothetical protein
MIVVTNVCRRIGAVQPDVGPSPTGAELVAAHGELADEVGEHAVLGISAGFGAHDRDGGVGRSTHGFAQMLWCTGTACARERDADTVGWANARYPYPRTNGSAVVVLDNLHLRSF